MVKFNDNDRKVVNLDYITQIEYDPFVIGGEDGNRYIKFYFLGRTSCILEYSDLDKYYKDKEYGVVIDEGYDIEDWIYKEVYDEI